MRPSCLVLHQLLSPVVKQARSVRRTGKADQHIATLSQCQARVRNTQAFALQAGRGLSQQLPSGQAHTPVVNSQQCFSCVCSPTDTSHKLTHNHTATCIECWQHHRTLLKSVVTAALNIELTV